MNISNLTRKIIFVLLFGTACFSASAQVDPSPDERYKTDLLLVIGHPDDETFIAPYLARVAFDQHKRISVIICTDSDAGGNVHGPESGAALGYLQIIEGKRAFASFGIDNVWFVNGHDTPGQNVLWSLGHWNHGAVLGEVTRLLRMTRPEVILTSLPAPVVGENHGDHQAAGVIATEAFDLAADPAAFPEQVAPAHELRGVGNLTEGLQPWQAKKLYYFTDAFDAISQYWDDPKNVSPFRPNFLVGAGPEYSSSEISPSKRVSYAQLSAVESSSYLSQEGIGETATAALDKNDFRAYSHPVRLIFGKTVLGKSGIAADVFDGITPGEASYTAPPGYHLAPVEPFRIGGAWEFYSHFWKIHGIEHIAHLLPTPELAIGSGATIALPITITNSADVAEEVVIKSSLPPGWSERGTQQAAQLNAHSSTHLQTVLTAPTLTTPQWQELRWTASANGKQVGEILIRVLAGKNGGLPQ
jgi:LmbE family N-acetylglucosaminyl deacetylase